MNLCGKEIKTTIAHWEPFFSFVGKCVFSSLSGVKLGLGFVEFFGNDVQGVLALCEFHYCEFGYCGFSKLLLKICLMRFLCTITLVNADISYRYMPNAIFG